MFFTLKINFTQNLTRATTAGTHGNASVVVTRTSFAFTLGKTFDWVALPKVATVNQNRMTLARGYGF
jgi:hypothetical protein